MLFHDHWETTSHSFSARNQWNQLSFTKWRSNVINDDPWYQENLPENELHLNLPQEENPSKDNVRKATFDRKMLLKDSFDSPRNFHFSQRSIDILFMVKSARYNKYDIRKLEMRTTLSHPWNILLLRVVSGTSSRGRWRFRAGRKRVENKI